MRILPSHPDFEKISEVWNMYAMAKNPHLFLGQQDLESYEIDDVLTELEFIMKTLLEERKSINLIRAVVSALDIKW